MSGHLDTGRNKAERVIFEFMKVLKIYNLSDFTYAVSKCLVLNGKECIYSFHYHENNNDDKMRKVVYIRRIKQSPKQPVAKQYVGSVEAGFCSFAA